MSRNRHSSPAHHPDRWAFLRSTLDRLRAALSRGPKPRINWPKFVWPTLTWPAWLKRQPKPQPTPNATPVYASPPPSPAEDFMRGLRQAPWRIQTQLTAAWAITLLTAVIVGGLYLAVASRTATAGRDVQTLEARKAELQLENDQLRAELATLRSLTRLQERARALGFQPAQAEQIEYLAVSTYPLNAHVPVPLVETAPPAPTLSEWLAEALTAIVPHWSR